MDDTQGGVTRSPHVLRPHHLLLLYVMMYTFSESSQKNLPPAFLLHVYRFLLRHIAEVSEPSSFDQLMEELAAFPATEENDPKLLVEALNDTRNEPHNVDQLTGFFGALSWLFIDKGNTEAPLDRRSLFGYFCRRCFVTFVKLSFAGAAQIQRNYLAWKMGHSSAGYDKKSSDRAFGDGGLIFKTNIDKKQGVQTEPLAEFEIAFANGDELSAADNLRAFFEQHFHENLDSGYRQHALLQHGRIHYLRDEFAEARRLLQEAIALCRVKSDKVTLMHCMALLHRLPPVERGQRAILNETQPELHPNELLYDVKKLLLKENDQPLSAAFRKITEAVGLYDHYIDAQGHQVDHSEQWGQHAVQSIVWQLAGRGTLAKLERNVVLASTDLGTNNETRLSVLLSYAHEMARQGDYEVALAILIEPDTWRGLDFVQYPEWASHIWHIFVLRASRRGMVRQYRELLLPHRPSPLFVAREYWHGYMKTNEQSSIQNRLRDVLYMRKHDQAPAAIEQLLSALWKAEFQCRFGLYRTGILLLADVGLEFGMSERCRRIVEEIMPQVEAHGDVEQQALAHFTLGRCIMACKESSPASMEAALPWFQKAEEEYHKLNIFGSLADVQFMLAIVFHNLDRITERDAAAARQVETDEQMSRLEQLVIEDSVVQVWQLVTDVGAALAARTK